jgi:hypothetical protein
MTDTKTNIKLTDGINTWEVEESIFDILQECQTCDTCQNRIIKDCGSCREGLENNYIAAKVVND